MTQTQRDNQLHQWLTTIFNEKFEHERLLGDASFRSYHRLIVNQGEKNQQNYIFMDAPPDKESVKEFIAVDKLMTGYVHVPKLIAINEEQGFIVLEDLGKTDFADKIGEYNEQTRALYQKAMQTILAMQKIDINHAKQILPNYDETLLKKEMALFEEWFLPYIGVKLDEKTNKIWQNLQNHIVNQVTTQPQVLVHRDFHSRNLMIVNDDVNQDLGVIDFQDAVIGAYTYDIVSLLRDAYVNWTKEQTEVWFDEFYAMLNTSLPNLSKAQFTLDNMIMGLQRHLKVLGIFVRLYERDGKSRYLANLPRVMQDTLLEAKYLAEQEGGVFAEFYQWLDSDIKLKFNEKLK